MNNQQRKYLTARLESEANAAIVKFVAAHTKPVDMEAREKYVEQELAKTNLVPSRGWSYRNLANYFVTPEDPDIEANKAAIDQFKKDVTAAKQQAMDAVNLGGDPDAAAALATFTAALAELAIR